MVFRPTAKANGVFSPDKQVADAGSGRFRWVPEGSGAGSRMVPQGSARFHRVPCMVPDGSGRFQRVLHCSGAGFRMVPDGCGRFRKVVESSGKFRCRLQVQVAGAGCGGFPTALESSGAEPSAGCKRRLPLVAWR